MITPGFVQTMARYNSHMNREVYAAADRLGEAARRQDRGAFWHSIHGTLAHIAWADQMWMSRFEGWDKPAELLAGSDQFGGEFPALHASRRAMDERLQDWADQVDAGWLAAEQHWFSGATQSDRVKGRATLVMHLFNHQTHHRGQAHAMITAAGERTGDTDLWLLG